MYGWEPVNNFEANGSLNSGSFPTPRKFADAMKYLLALLGHKHVETTMIYTHVLNCGG